MDSDIRDMKPFFGDGSARRAIRSVVASVREHPRLCVALTLFWTWFLVTLQGPIRFPLIPAIPLYIPSWGPTILFMVLGMFACVRLSARGVTFKWALVLSAAFMTVGLLLTTGWLSVESSVTWGVFVYLAGSALMGMGAGGFLVTFCRLYGGWGTVAVLHHGIVSLVGAALIQIAFTVSWHVALASIFTPLFPPVMFACLLKYGETQPRPLVEQPGTPLTASKFVLTMAAQGVSFGLGIGMLAFWDGIYVAPRLVGGLCALVAALLLLVMAFKLKFNFTYMVYLVGFPVISVGLLLVACSGPLLVLGNSLQAIGSCYLYVLDIALFVFVARASQGDAGKMCLLGAGCLFVAQFVGGCLGSTLALNAHGESAFLMLVAVLSVMVLLLALYISNTGTIERGWGSARPGVMTAEWLERQVASIAAKHNLTPREREVVTLMARGRSRQDISEDLCVSEETVKTHFRNVYQKLGVHSQQELLALVLEHEAD